ncbi:MAG: hypothetical protein EOO59_12085, partial [Hymenobacter sp.]
MTAPVSLADLFTPADWLALLEVSLTGIHLVRPVYEPDGTTIVDFAIEYLNPAGQRMTGLAEQPGAKLEEIIQAVGLVVRFVGQLLARLERAPV